MTPAGGYRLRYKGDPVLRQVCARVDDPRKLNGLVDYMLDYVRENNAGGLAAPQIGEPVQVVVARLNGWEVKEFINPDIISGSGFTINGEGCLSIPKRKYWRARKEVVTVSYQDRHGLSYEKEFKDFAAIVLQHEIDHLRGKLISDFL